MAELRQKDSPRNGQTRRWPVLDGLEAAGLSGRDVAAVAGVTAPTVSKWRSGRLHIPGRKLAFLTLVLAHLLEELNIMIRLEAEWGTLMPNWSERTEPRGEAALRSLEIQEGLNLALAAADVRKGAQMFRAWWASGSAVDFQDVVARAFVKRLSVGKGKNKDEAADRCVGAQEEVA